jgi:pSer/pThr/pTyr-binding forkhead associated (FHA) protein
VYTEGGSAPPLVVWSEGTDRSLPPGPSYVVGRDPESDIVITDARVSWRHAVLRLEDGRWVLTDDGSTNGTYAGDQRVDRIEITGNARSGSAIPATGRSSAAPSVGATRARQAGHPPAWISAR